MSRSLAGPRGAPQWGIGGCSSVWRWTRFLGAAWLLALVGPVMAQEVDYGSLLVTPVATLPIGTLHGYHELAFELVSRSASPQEVTLRAPETAVNGTLTTLERLERSVVVPAGGRLRLSLFQPALQLAGRRLQVVIDGRQQRDTLDLGALHPLAWSSSPGKVAPRVLLSRRARGLADHVAMTEDVVGFAQTSLPLDQWSRQWLAYSGWDGVVLGRDEASEAPAPVVEALSAYVETGGTVWIVGSDEPGAGEGAPSGRRLIGGRLAARWPLADCVERPNGWQCSAGLGWLLLSAGLDGVEGADLAVDQAWRETLAPWVKTLEPGAPQSLVPVVDSLGVPVRGLFVLLLVFTLVVGPLNVALLSRRGKRPWILVTIPAISLLACVALLLASWLGEGLVRERRLDGFTFLDQPGHRASSYAWAGYYSTLVPRSGLSFGSATEVTPFLDTRDWRLTRQRPGKSLIWDGAGGQRLARGWMRARVPTYLALRKHEPRRERLEVSTGAAGVTVVNGIGCDLRSLLLADEGGRLWGLDRLTAGARAELEQREGLAQGGHDWLRQLYRDELPSRLQKLASVPEGTLRPGTYLAALASSPFVEPGLAEAEGLENLWLIGRWSDLRGEVAPRQAEAVAGRDQPLGGGA